MESDDLDTFLRLKETYDAADEDRPAPPVQPIGVPGAASPLQMTPEHLKTKILAQNSSPLKDKGNSVPVNKRQGEFDVSTELEGYGLQGVKVTEDELRDLVAELGLDGDDAGDLVKGLSSGGSSKAETKEKMISEEAIANLNRGEIGDAGEDSEKGEDSQRKTG